MSGNGLCKREIVNTTETNFVYSRNKQTKNCSIQFHDNGQFLRPQFTCAVFDTTGLVQQGGCAIMVMTELSYFCFSGSLFLRYLDSHVSSVLYDTF